MEYRVIEISPTAFILEVKDVNVQCSGFLWWKKIERIESWVRADDRGVPMYYYPGRSLYLPPQSFMKPFTSLDAALAKIKALNTPPKIHYPISNHV